MMDVHSHPSRVAVVGAGNVGATFAYALLLKRTQLTGLERHAAGGGE